MQVTHVRTAISMSVDIDARVTTQSAAQPFFLDGWLVQTP